MNLDYNDEQNMLREQIQKFCESEYDFYKREEIVKSSNDFDEKSNDALVDFIECIKQYTWADVELTEEPEPTYDYEEDEE